jgi:tetratricopeptide (TPR) repeat protein
MNTKIIFITALFTSSILGALAQNTDEEAIKNVIRVETESYINRDSVAWKDQFIQDENTTRMFAGNGFYVNSIGWNSFGPYLIQWMKEDPKPKRYSDIVQSNFIIKLSENLAWLVYDQKLSAPGNDSIPGTYTREFRTLVKDNKQWKISSIMTVDSLSYSTSNPGHIEFMFNETGYSFLANNKINEAIEVFKLNVKLYPTAWNTYDSLGEAYAAAGNKDLAIENYKKSIELNPDNEHGKEMLRKLEEE